MSPFPIEYIPYLGTHRCTQCGQLNVKVQITFKSALADHTLPDKYHDKEMVNLDNSLHYCTMV